MKQIFNLILIIFYQDISLAQEFATKDSKWVFDYNGAWSKGKTEVQYDKDTLIAGETVRKHSKKATRLLRFDNRLVSFDLNPVYIRSKDGIIEFSEDAILFDTLINFKASKGQSWKIFRHRNSKITDSIKITIIDTFRTKISGIDLFTQAAKYESPGWSPFVDTVYEYIGVRWLYILPFDEKDVNLDGGEGGLIRCFSNSLLGVVSFDNMQYGSDFKYDCDNLTFVNNNAIKKSDIYIYSNPFSKSIQVYNNTSRNCFIQLFNINGVQVFEKRLEPELQILNLSSLDSGFYLISINGNIIDRIVTH
ncbi:MAG: T9SS type A sorting domain-containing protein [Saprospiraceae bacterium]|nr:T9SS type A sorting domain-containing protein [Saprospiraceae bacterium]